MFDCADASAASRQGEDPRDKDRTSFDWQQAIIDSPPRMEWRSIFSMHSPVNDWRGFLLCGGADRSGRWKNAEGTSTMMRRWNDREGTA
ncbi:hypothetical protein GFL88_30210 [Rhizobium leguminosarum bv. viciae]|nr:hypothetical protein [Rhizobium leguminosarum bv. viciae]